LPHLSAITVGEAAHLFHIPDLHSALGDFYSGKSYFDRRGQRISCNSTPLPFQKLNVWYNFKIQQKSAQDPTMICPSSTVQAVPPGAELPYGRCNAVLVTNNSNMNEMGSIHGLFNSFNHDLF
jgi:hypothetical protein